MNLKKHGNILVIKDTVVYNIKEPILFYIDKTGFVGLTPYTRKIWGYEDIRESSVALAGADFSSYRILLNIFDLPSGKEAEKILIGDDQEGINFIIEVLKNEQKEKSKQQKVG